MIVILQTSEKKHLGFILFSSNDSNCIFQILPKEPNVFETKAYKKLIEYNDRKERPYEKNNSIININGVDKPNIKLNFKNEQWILRFDDDNDLNIYATLKK